MAKRETRRIPPPLLVADEKAYIALQAIPDYKPANDAYSKVAMKALNDDMLARQAAAIEAQAAADAARDAQVLSEWAFHDGMIGSTEQVAAQYGKNSDQYQSLGKKKKIEYKTPRRKAKKNGSDK